MNKVSNEPIIDDYDTLGQTYVISSKNPVADHQGFLAGKRPRIRRGKRKETLGSRVRGLVQSIASTGHSNRESQPNDPEKTRLNGLLRNLSVYSRGCRERPDDSLSSSDPQRRHRSLIDCRYLRR